MEMAQLSDPLPTNGTRRNVIWAKGMLPWIDKTTVQAWMGNLGSRHQEYLVCFVLISVAFDSLLFSESLAFV